MKKWIIGIDEVGRGPLAGPVYICAVAISLKTYKAVSWEGLTDSKRMTAAARQAWHGKAKAMEKDGALKIALASRSAAAIDREGISVCIRQCIQAALQKLQLDPRTCVVLLDGGLKAPSVYLDQRTIIRGDLSERAISLASVIAKVTRDRLMLRLHKRHALYGWNENKGYGTAKHLAALRRYGPGILHRKTFITRVF